MCMKLNINMYNCYILYIHNKKIIRNIIYIKFYPIVYFFFLLNIYSIYINGINEIRSVESCYKIVGRLPIDNSYREEAFFFFLTIYVRNSYHILSTVIPSELNYFHNFT